MEVVWGSVIETTGDVHLVGHYQGVLPQNAEEVLDKAVSDCQDPLVITDLTKRGVIRGALGDINFVPWGKSAWSRSRAWERRERSRRRSSGS